MGNNTDICYSGPKTYFEYIVLTEKQPYIGDVKILWTTIKYLSYRNLQQLFKIL